jgi:hypothetical protein
LDTLTQGKFGLAPASLDDFRELLVNQDLKIRNVELVAFLRDQVPVPHQIPRLCDSRFTLETFLKEVATLMEESDMDGEQKKVFQA